MEGMQRHSSPHQERLPNMVAKTVHTAQLSNGRSALPQAVQQAAEGSRQQTNTSTNALHRRPGGASSADKRKWTKVQRQGQLDLACVQKNPSRRFHHTVSRHSDGRRSVKLRVERQYDEMMEQEQGLDERTPQGRFFPRRGIRCHAGDCDGQQLFLNKNAFERHCNREHLAMAGTQILAREYNGRDAAKHRRAERRWRNHLENEPPERPPMKAPTEEQKQAAINYLTGQLEAMANTTNGGEQ